METGKLRETTKALNPHINFDVALTFYYDETNNIKKLHLKKGDFNVDYTASFVLGGFAYTGTMPDMADVFNGIQLQPSVVEVKLSHLAKGSFEDCLKSKYLGKFLENVTSKPLYLHFSELNLLYYSLVDIVDSALPIELMIYHRDFKNALYVACKMNLNDVLPLLVKYTYPNIPHDATKCFVGDLFRAIAPSKKNLPLGITLNKLEELLREAAENDELPFITDEEDYMLIKGLMELYARPVHLFANSEHFFDNECEIKEQLQNSPLLLNGQPMTNYKFLDSKTDKLIQASDVIIGLIGKMFKYINEKKHMEIASEIETMSVQQLSNLDLLLGLVQKTILFNEGFLHYTDSDYERSKIHLIGKLRKMNI